MVMRNPHEPPRGPDDLPPRILNRLRAWPPPEPTAVRTLAPPAAPARPARAEWVGDLARVVALLLAVAVGNILFLLAALSYIAP
jgi:hypothetical protein